ncbi:MAG: 3-methyl-2-oxobutanoate hydroxymethyltransferase, partial [Bdellovibrionales bacterium]|nr:3-methyl-2-oxobutanoate hydroxymethyltransferase [Bdellovibrionales bacterium]
MKTPDFKRKKIEKSKITMLTCYDYWSACLLNTTNVDCLLVGDSLGMVMHGFKSTIPVTTELTTIHVSAVAKGAPDKFIVGDMPFLSYRKSLDINMKNVEQLIQAGASAIKLEGCKGNLDLIEHIVDSGVPVMGHLGLTPQSINQLGGFKVQGREPDALEKINSEALTLQEAGCFSV